MVTATSNKPSAKKGEFVFDSINLEHILRKHKLVESSRYVLCVRSSVPDANKEIPPHAFSPHNHRSNNLITVRLRIHALLNRNHSLRLECELFSTAKPKKTTDPSHSRFNIAADVIIY